MAYDRQPNKDLMLNNCLRIRHTKLFYSLIMSENQINQLMKSREFSFLNKIWNLTFRLTSENIDTIGSRNLAHSNFLFIIKSSDGIICGGYYD